MLFKKSKLTQRIVITEYLVRWFGAYEAWVLIQDTNTIHTNTAIRENLKIKRICIREY